MAEAANIDRTADNPLDRGALRRALGAFATGVTIVTGRDADGAPVGFTANSFTSVSLDPPLVLACIGVGAASYAAFRNADGFAVNILAAGQRDLAMRFATRGADKFAGGEWVERATGAPVLNDGAAWFDCVAHQILDAGDHAVMIGRVVAFGRRDARPLAYHDGRFAEVAPLGQAAAFRLVAALRRGDRALLRRTDEGLRLPSAAAFGPVEAPGTLTGLLRVAPGGGATGPLTPVDAWDDGATHVVAYAAEVATPAAGGDDADGSWVWAPVATAPGVMACRHEAEAVARLWGGGRDPGARRATP